MRGPGLRGPLLAAALLALLLLGAAPLASAAPKLMVYDVLVSADPAIQGPDLPIVVGSSAGCGGACCYVVYGMELKAELLLPAGAKLLDGDRSQWLTSPGQAQGTVAAQPGGGLTWVASRWTVNCTSYGTYELAVRVTGTNDAGDRINYTGFVNVTIASGAAISSPIFPHRPVVGKDTIVLANVSSRKGVRAVYLETSPDNQSWSRVQMGPVEGELWRATIPASSAETEFFLRMQSIDTAGEPFNTTVYRIRVTDPGKVLGISSGATLLVTAGSLAGMALILYFGARRLSVFRSSGVYLVGDGAMEASIREREQMRLAQRRLVALRWKVLAAVAAVTAVLFIAAVLTGQIDKVVSHTTNPSEAFIWVGRTP